jgi:hypothetical protein
LNPNEIQILCGANLNSEDLQLAISYAELAQSLAFSDFLQFQRSECERLELAALNAPPTDFEACRSAIIAWQQRRLVVKTFEQTVIDSANALKSAELENADARNTSRSDRSGW